METRKHFETIDEYIAAAPQAVREILEQMRLTIHETAPQATEAISYQMPTFRQNGNLVHFAAFKNHIGLYPMAAAIEAFKAELAEYKTSKGAIQFPLSKPIPYELVKQIVRYRVEQVTKPEAQPEI